MPTRDQWRCSTPQGLLHQATASLVLGAGLLLAWFQAGAVDGEAIRVLRPATASDTWMESTGGRADAEPFVTRTGVVVLETSRFLSSSFQTEPQTGIPPSFQRRSLTLTFFPDVSVEIEISADSRPSPEILSLNGRLAGQELATWSLTVTPESYLITYDDPQTTYLYRVVGDSETGLGRVTEIDRRDMPPVLHLPPLVPPVN